MRLNNAWQYLSLPLLLFITLPLVALFLHISPAKLTAALNGPTVRQALGLSLSTSLATMLITILLGTPVAYRLAQRQFLSYHIFDSLIDLPTVLPPAVAGVALLIAFGRRGVFGNWLGSIGIGIPFTTLAVIMAQTFVASSLYVKSAAAGFATVSEELKGAASLDGANEWQIFSAIAIPLAGPALLTGSVMTWARALGEFGATMIFAGNFPGRTQTMPLAIYMGFEIDLDVALTLSLILVGFSFLTLILVKGLLHARIENRLE